GYDRLFGHTGGGVYTHDFGGGFVEFGSTDGTDIGAAREGLVSITPLRMPAAASIPDDIRALLER
ncbi:MAG TPA: hypothetical protein VFD97_07585, partial [Acidimicrobiia bacterium]|nr:hypothetical protein [Acidimicrobiia bacterium]